MMEGYSLDPKGNKKSYSDNNITQLEYDIMFVLPFA